MSSTDFGNLVYLGLLGAVLISYFLISHRQNLGQITRHAIMWGLIFVGVIAAFGLWSDIRKDVLPRQAVFEGEGRIELPMASDGHYYLTAAIDGTPVTFVVDTGATDIVLSRRDAERVGIDPDALVYSGRAGTANGVVETARTQVATFAVGAIEDRNVNVWVNRGEMRGSLLGMAYLSRFDRVEIADGQMVLER